MVDSKMKNAKLILLGYIAATIVSCIPGCWKLVGGILGLRTMYYITRYLDIANGFAVKLILIIFILVFGCLFYVAMIMTHKSILPFLLMGIMDFLLCCLIAIILSSNSLPFDLTHWFIGCVTEVAFFSAVIIAFQIKNKNKLKWNIKIQTVSAKRKLLSILMTVFWVPVLAFLSWSSIVFHYELLTYHYEAQFSEAYKQNAMLGEQSYYKVLYYSENAARIYCVEKDKSIGNILVFVRDGDSWKMDSWDTVWSKTGSASEFVWPYFR